MTQTTRPRFALVTVICIAIIVLDRITKTLAESSLWGRPPHIYVGDLFRLEYSENPGAFLSLGAKMSADTRIWMLTVAVGVLLLAMGWFLARKRMPMWTTTALSLLLGGGIGNWIDRAFRPSHTVVDFMNTGIGSLRTGIFNVADMAITAGVAILLIQSFCGESKVQD